MAKVSSIEKNKRRVRIVSIQAAKRSALKKLIMNKSITLEERFAAVLKLGAMPRDGSKVRIRNRCEVSGRARGFYRDFRLSRIAFRELASMGKIPGVTKSSW
ncbi:30S ribosomal protein S14 [Candidatus Liberibacter americanus]|uniref:Small ribosomal subunit protein uS14 n=1 Tax=Candidatus Liberibacter americanus str. Sao Paulo TaxID=1261131 RepID=U6B968_9HYPH|nr:30S ribosomal protein S14 [Candidatus Liberibacter americanus]AHA28262.1 Ribosomal protein S14 [Candidatus Liberibacter americanus str. Sao Paulo]EMS36224.1 30S ribosomal protein S14 [Candidatus Liberibacter americanus PW_SP]